MGLKMKSLGGGGASEYFRDNIMMQKQDCTTIDIDILTRKQEGIIPLIELILLH